MPLQIPEEYIPALVKIRKLSRPQAEELIGALKSAPPEFDHEELARRIAAHVQSMPNKDLVDILAAIYDLYFVREFANVSAAEFLDDLIEAFRDGENPNLAIGPKE